MYAVYDDVTQDALLADHNHVHVKAKAPIEDDDLVIAKPHKKLNHP